MTAFFAGIVDLVSAHPHFAYAAVFLLALSEAMPVIGTVVPGSTLILGISALAPRGILELWPLLVAAILGAIVGDALSFWLGHRYHQGILLRWPLNRYPQLVAHSETFFRRYGSFSVFLARFTPAVRAFVPLVAGIFQMRTDRFYVANVLSALVWAPLHVFPGVLVGALISMAGAAAGSARCPLDCGGHRSLGHRLGSARFSAVGHPTLRGRADTALGMGDVHR